MRTNRHKHRQNRNNQCRKQQYNKFKVKDLNKNQQANLHPSEREDAVEFILAGLDRSGVHEGIIELKKHRNSKTVKRKHITASVDLITSILRGERRVKNVNTNWIEA